MAGDDYTTTAFGQRSRIVAREEFQENFSFCLAISQDQPSATNATITQISNKDARNTQSGTRENTHLSSSQSRPSLAMSKPILLLLLLEANHNASEKLRLASKLSAVERSRTPAFSQRSRQPRPHPARKKFCIYIDIPDYADRRGFGHFKEAAWFTNNG